MVKKIKLNSLYLITLANVTGSYSKRKFEVIKDTCALAYAKYDKFDKGKIKYFVNVVDQTKYYPSGRLELGICAMTQIPISAILKDEEDLKRGYITIDKALTIIKRCSKLVREDKIYIEDIDFENNGTILYENKKNLPCGEILSATLNGVCPTIGREKEIENLIISLAQQKKNPLLVGPPGVGKTAIADTLAYLIATGTVPTFLKKREIVEVSAAEMVSNTKYLGEFEKKMIKLIEYLKSNNGILLINEIHEIYGAGASEKSNIDAAGLLKSAIDRDKLKIIGTTTCDEYKKFFTSNALKRRFEVIKVEEPQSELLYEIICYTFDNYSKITGISIDNLDKNITNILIDLTEEKHRRYDDKVCNPDLVIGIIDKAFAIARVYNCQYLTNEHLIKSIETNERIYDTAKGTAIKAIIESGTTQKVSRRVLQLR